MKIDSFPYRYGRVSTMQDTGKFRKNTKDQYYTKSVVAAKCIDIILSHIGDAGEYEWIEPSAGNGAFIKVLPENFVKVGIDIEPKSPGILQGNFLDWEPVIEKRRIFFGNPPFGRQGSLAKAFIKHASKYADVIAFILPRSFVKPSMSRAFPTKFHCIYSEELEKNSFEVNSVEYDVPCVFQVWQKRVEDRLLAAVAQAKGFEYVKKGEAFHIAFKRAGGLAGKCYASDPGIVYNWQYHYFLKLNEEYLPHIPKIIERVNIHVFPSNTVGPRSLSKSEANEVLNLVLEGVLS